MNTRTAACAALLTLAALTAGCDSSTDDKPANATPTPAGKPNASPTPSASTKAGPLALGEGHHWSDTDLDGSHISGTTTALAYTQPVKVGLPDDASDATNPEWAILEVRLCADKTSSNVQTSQGPWTLGFPDGSRIDAPSWSGGGVPKPEYPTDGALVTPGECLKGKITFDLEKGNRPDRIIYAVDDRDPVTWTVPKA